MKGNEARVVFFLHPVDQLKDGQVQPLRRSFVVSALLLLGLLLGLGVLVFVLLQFGVETKYKVPFDTTTKSPGTERTTEPVSASVLSVPGTRNQSEPVPFESPVTNRTGEPEGSTDVTINQTRANYSTAKTKLPTAEIIQPGITYDAILCHQSK